MIWLLLQVATPPAQPGAERWSILESPCPRGEDGEIVVCAPEVEQRVKRFPGDPPPDRPRQPTGDATGSAALEMSGKPCAVSGCNVGTGVNLLWLGKTLLDEAQWAARRKAPGRREPIRLD